MADESHMNFDELNVLLKKIFSSTDKSQTYKQLSNLFEEVISHCVDNYIDEEYFKDLVKIMPDIYRNEKLISHFSNGGQFLEGIDRIRKIVEIKDKNAEQWMTNALQAYEDLKYRNIRFLALTIKTSKKYRVDYYIDRHYEYGDIHLAFVDYNEQLPIGKIPIKVKVIENYYIDSITGSPGNYDVILKEDVVSTKK